LNDTDKIVPIDFVTDVTDDFKAEGSGTACKFWMELTSCFEIKVLFEIEIFTIWTDLPAILVLKNLWLEGQLLLAFVHHLMLMPRPEGSDFMVSFLLLLKPHFLGIIYFLNL